MMRLRQAANKRTLVAVVLLVVVGGAILLMTQDPTTFLLAGIHGLTFAALLFVVASGFTLVFGLMGITNLAHGGFYLLGGYVGYSIAAMTGNWPIALAAGAVGAGVVGLLAQQLLLRPVQGDEMREALVTVGLSIVIADQLLAFYGGYPDNVPLPSIVSGALELGSRSMRYPTFRLAVLGIGIIVGFVLLVILRRTRLGMAIRAGVDDREMLGAIGVNVRMVFAVVFLLGSSLAGFSGVIGGSFLSLAPGEDSRMLLYSLVVVVVGGMRSVTGAALGALLVGLTAEYAAVYAPTYAALITFGMMVVVLIIRPSGLLGSER
jgi:branched-chain amino acid transport system permease protein